MKTPNKRPLCLLVLLAAFSVQSNATVRIQSLGTSPKAPQLIGTAITWTVAATDTNPGPLTFQFNVAAPGGGLTLVKDFNAGMLQAGIWHSQPFIWVPTGIEGSYMIQVVAKDFKSGETDSRTLTYTVSPLVTGTQPVVAATANPLVALFSAPSCPAGGIMAVSFLPHNGTSPAIATNYQSCHPPATMTFELAGMYPNTQYDMYSLTNAGGSLIPGPVISYTTGALPSAVSFPSFTVNIPVGAQTDTTDRLILQNVSSFGNHASLANVATDLSGNILWYYNPGNTIYLTRPLLNGNMLTIQSGLGWTGVSTELQLLREIDLAGNVIKETNLSLLSEELLAMGASDAQMCQNVPRPPPVGSACLNSFHHDAIQTLPNGDTAVFAAVEKIFPAGTQGDTSGLPVDIIGDMIIVLDTNWQAIWYFDAFQHDGGAPQLDINRTAVLNEICTAPQSQGCPPLFLAGPHISPIARDWLHGNSLYYWPKDGSIIWSGRNQDWVMKVDYNNGAGTGNILWRMGPCGDFAFNNVNQDAWPWFSHQHEFGIENGGTGVATVFDNGNTRYSQPGAASGCMAGLGTGNSRGMALTIDENAMQVTPVLSDDLGMQGLGDGSAQLLYDGEYSFLASDVIQSQTKLSYVLEISPAAGTTSGTQVLNIGAANNYRIWRMASLYNPPTT